MLCFVLINSYFQSFLCLDLVLERQQSAWNSAIENVCIIIIVSDFCIFSTSSLGNLLCYLTCQAVSLLYLCTVDLDTGLSLKDFDFTVSTATRVASFSGSSHLRLLTGPDEENAVQRHSWPNGHPPPLSSCCLGDVSTQLLCPMLKRRCVQDGRAGASSIDTYSQNSYLVNWCFMPSQPVRLYQGDHIKD